MGLNHNSKAFSPTFFSIIVRLLFQISSNGICVCSKETRYLRLPLVIHILLTIVSNISLQAKYYTSYSHPYQDACYFPVDNMWVISEDPNFPDNSPDSAGSFHITYAPKGLYIRRSNALFTYSHFLLLLLKYLYKNSSRRVTLPPYLFP